MNKKLSFTNKGFQSIDNGCNFKDSIRHYGVEQEIVGRLIPSYPGYLDQYLYGAGEMHIHFRWLDERPIETRKSLRGKIPRDWCVVLKKLTVNSQRLIESNRRLREVGVRKIKEEVSSPTTNRDKLTMFISVFEAADDSQNIEMRQYPCMIRLQFYDECPSLRMQSLNSTFSSFPQISVIDHEVSLLVLSEDILKKNGKARLSSALFGNTCNNNIIKCTSQVMYEITEHDGNHWIRLLGDIEASPDLFMSIQQPDTCETVRIAFCVPHGFLFDVYHVLLSTPNFEPPTLIHDMLYYPKGEDYGRTKTENTQGVRDTRAHKGRFRTKSKKDSQTKQINVPKPEEVKPQTSHARHSGGCNAKNTRSGSLEDA
jgi:hypothetical protein